MIVREERTRVEWRGSDNAYNRWDQVLYHSVYLFTYLCQSEPLYYKLDLVRSVNNFKFLESLFLKWLNLHPEGEHLCQTSGTCSAIKVVLRAFIALTLRETEIGLDMNDDE